MSPRLPALAVALLLLGCVTPGPQAGGGDPANQPFFRPGEVTPVPEGVVGTPDPFLAAHPATSAFVLPSATIANPAPIKATYVVAAIDQVAGGWRISCLARGLAPNGNPLELRFELLVDRPPPAPASWPVVRTPELVLGQGRVTHYFGAGSGYEGVSGSIAVSRVDRRADAVAYDFAVNARLEPSSAGPGTPKTTPTPGAGAATAAPPATAPPATPTPATPTPATPSPSPGASPSPTASPVPAAPHRVLAQFEDTKTVRWTGTFYVRPEAVP